MTNPACSVGCDGAKAPPGASGGAGKTPLALVAPTPAEPGAAFDTLASSTEPQLRRGPVRRQRSTSTTVLVRIYLAAETLRLEIEKPGAAGALASNSRDLQAEASASRCPLLAGR